MALVDVLFALTPLFAIGAELRLSSSLGRCLWSYVRCLKSYVRYLNSYVRSVRIFNEFKRIY